MAGDVILSYDGERVFTFNEVRARSYRGSVGETVLVEVRRIDGTIDQLTIPRGPLGVSSGRGFREPPP